MFRKLWQNEVDTQTFERRIGGAKQRGGNAERAVGQGTGELTSAAKYEHIELRKATIPVTTDAN